MLHTGAAICPLLWGKVKFTREKNKWRAIFAMVALFTAGYAHMLLFLIRLPAVASQEMLIAVVYFSGALFVSMTLRVCYQTADELVSARALSERAVAADARSKAFEEKAAELARLNEELLNSREQLLQLEKMTAVGQLAAGVAHEINNPLGVILGFAQSVQKGMQPSDALAFPLKSIEREALRCKNLVESLLVFSRKNRHAEAELELNETIESILNVIEPQLRLNAVKITKDFGALDRVLGDKNQLQQVIVNLCSNAIDAMPKGGKIVIRTRNSDIKDRPGVILEVEDTGSGIPKEIQNKIFNPFFTTKEVGKGTGLGLSLVYEIIQRHKGTIELRSEVGLGAMFIIFLPVR